MTWGFVHSGRADPLRAPPRFVDIGEEYVRRIVDLSPGQRKRYLGQLQVLAGTLGACGSLVFTRPVTSIHESDIKEWLIDWDRSLQTKANYHGLIHGVFVYAVKARLPHCQPGDRYGAQAVLGQAIAA